MLWGATLIQYFMNFQFIDDIFTSIHKLAAQFLFSHVSISSLKIHRLHRLFANS
jgi:hypothetical protein